MYVDRRDQPHWVYRCYDADGVLLYIGCTANPKGRAKQHKTSSMWFEHMARHILRGPYDYDTARQVERELINAMGPAFNETSAQMSERRRAYWRGLSDRSHASQRDQLETYLQAKSEAAA